MKRGFRSRLPVTPGWFVTLQLTTARQRNGMACCRERDRNVLFNDALNTFYLRLYGVRHTFKDHSDSEKGNPLPPHRLLLSISSKGSFKCTIPQTGYHGLCYTSRGALAGTRNSSMGGMLYVYSYYLTTLSTHWCERL